MKIQANGINMNYEITGRGDDLVLIHGLGNNLKLWFNQVPAFSKEYRVLTYDVRGHGRSDQQGEYRFSVWAKDLYELLRTLKIPSAHILGFSLGGAIAATLAIQHPEMVKSLIISNSGGRPATEEAKLKAAQRNQAEVEAFSNSGLEGVYQVRKNVSFAPGFPEKHPAVMEKYKEMLFGNRPENYMKLANCYVNREPIDFSKIAAPTLILVGEQDVSSGPEAGKIVQSMIRGSQLVIMPTGHASCLEMPEEYNGYILKFLAGVTSTSTSASE
jgi:(E)-2-((N-methylformamido)methylene)succinate hydrolase